MPCNPQTYGCGLVESTNASGSDHSSSFSSKDRLSLNDTPSLVPTLQQKFNVAPQSQIIPELAAFVSDRTSIAIGSLAPYHHATPFLRSSPRTTHHPDVFLSCTPISRNLRLEAAQLQLLLRCRAGARSWRLGRIVCMQRTYRWDLRHSARKGVENDDIDNQNTRSGLPNSYFQEFGERLDSGGNLLPR
jgi:hypothetical protein